MSKPSKPAFAHTGLVCPTNTQEGISDRMYIAVAAMQAILSNPSTHGVLSENMLGEIVKSPFLIADVMISEEHK